jgi:serine/threonine protein kinase
MYTRVSDEYEANTRPKGSVLQVPRIIWSGKYRRPGSDTEYSALIMDKCGSSLTDVLEYYKNKHREIGRTKDVNGFVCPLRVLYSIAIHGLTALSQLHNADVIHRDIKPDNFCVPLREPVDSRSFSSLFVIDFGLAKVVSGTYQDAKARLGTIPFASIKAHYPREQSFSDDVQAFMYVLAELMHGNLPWHDATPTKIDEDPWTYILEHKKEWSGRRLFFNRVPAGRSGEGGSDPRAMRFREALARIFDSLAECKHREQPPYNSFMRLLDSVMQS